MNSSQQILFLAYAGFLGACIGSFLNVVIYRLPLEKSLIRPGSHCPKCDKPIRWFDNIPLLSYLILGGKCRNCRVNIPLRYPFVEFLTALVFMLLFAVDVLGVLRGPSDWYVFAVHCVFAASLIAVTFIDFDHKIIPDEISIGGTFLALVVSILLPDKLLALPSFTAEWSPYVAGGVMSLIGGFAGAGITWMTGVFGKIAFKKDAMGFGDVKLMAFIGCLLGWQAALIVFFTAPFFGLMVAVPQLFIKKDHYIAYGPFLSLAALLYIILQPLYRDALAMLFAG